MKMNMKVKNLIKICLSSMVMVLIIFSISCSAPTADPKVAFNKWFEAAKERKYHEMFKYESFLIPQVEYCYKTIIEGNWADTTDKEKDDFIDEFYKPAVILGLEDIKNENYDALLRTDPKIKLQIDVYEVKGDQVKMWLKGEFSFDELVKMKMNSSGEWRLENPLGYHSYIPTLKNIRKIIADKK